MKMPTSILETTFKEFAAAPRSSVPSVSAVPEIIPPISAAPASSGFNIKPEHVIVGIAAVAVVFTIIYLIEKRKEDDRKSFS